MNGGFNADQKPAKDSKTEIGLKVTTMSIAKNLGDYGISSELPLTVEPSVAPDHSRRVFVQGKDDRQGVHLDIGGAIQLATALESEDKSLAARIRGAAEHARQKQI